jgi:hypothetical protein
MNLTFDLPKRCRHPPTKSPRISRAGDGQKGARHGSHPFGSLGNPNSKGLTKKKLRPWSIFTNNTSVFTTLALRSDWGWTLRTSIGSPTASISLKS